ncbi:MAG: phosphoribosylformylglycinamidine synthase subunit PurS [Candidatus Bathyarchaeia archaeon]
MKYRARVEISLKSGLSDPEGETSAASLRDLGYKVHWVSTGKVYYIHLEAGSLEEAQGKVDEMCRRLLANPVKDDYMVQVEKME